MSDLLNTLNEEQKSFIRKSSRFLNDTECSERFSEEGDDVFFEIMTQTDESLLGGLDVDNGDEVNAHESAEVEPERPPVFETRKVRLIPAKDFDYDPEVAQEDVQAAKKIDEQLAQYQDYFQEDLLDASDLGEAVAESETASLPVVMDYRYRQSPVKNQGSRGTCVSHAAVALLEAYLHIPDNLSEQYAHYKFNEFLNRPHNRDNGLRTTDAAPFLARSDGRICLERHWPYISRQSDINRLVRNRSYRPPVAAINNQTYGYKSKHYKIIKDRGLVGESIKNTRYLEALIYQGYHVVIGTWVSWDDKDNNGILDPVLDSKGNPVGRGGHAMLVVGYNRQKQYFIVKNSWGRGWGHSGYAYLHYNLARSCFKYGYVIDQVVPKQPPEALPNQLRYAPYRKSKISRSDLRAVVLFMKTSRGRYAVCEAYAGYNLYLKNLKVYNSNGSLHLEKDSLMIRGTYSCDLDSGRETRYGADFWWQAVRRGVNYLVPTNGARAHIAFNLARLDHQRIRSRYLGSAAVPSKKLNYAVVVGKTTASRYYKMLLHSKPNNQLEIAYLEVYDGSGRRYIYRRGITVPATWTYNLDTLNKGGGRYADIWWQVVSDNVGFLNKYSYAKTELVWCV